MHTHLGQDQGTVPFEDARRTLRPSPIVSVANRSITQVDLTAERGLEFHQSSGGVGPSMQTLLRRDGNAVVYATATTDAERSLAAEGLVVPLVEGVWIRYVRIPDEMLRQFYDLTVNQLLYAILHGQPERLIGPRRFARLAAHPVAAARLAGFRARARKRPAIALSAGVHPLIYARRFRTAFEGGYRAVNREFAEILARELALLDGPRLLIHDHHFALLPQLLRQNGYRGRLAVFIHVPWPEDHLFLTTLPRTVAAELMDGLLASDVIGFHTRTYSTSFASDAAELFDRVASPGEDSLRAGGARPDGAVELLVNPLPVDPDYLVRCALSDEALDFAQALRTKVRDRVLIVRSERVDPMKGVYEGLRAIQLLLEEIPEVRSAIQLFAVLQPSRLQIPLFARYLERINGLADRINARHGARGATNGVIRSGADRRRLFAASTWPPIVLFECRKEFEEVVGAMVAANLGCFTSLADGLNLSIKEFGVVNGPAITERVGRALRARFGAAASRVQCGVAVASQTLGAFAQVKGAVCELDDPEDPRAVARAHQRGIELVRFHQDDANQMALDLSSRLVGESLEAWLERMVGPSSPGP